MRIPLLTLFALAAVAGCDRGPPSPADVAGIYDQVSQNGVTIPGGGLQRGTMELRADGTLDAEWIIDIPFIGEGVTDTTATEGSFTVGAMEGGCLPIMVRLENEPNDPGAGTLCDDLLTVVGGEDTLVFLLRQR